MNIRLKYTKKGDIRYISHLDIVKLMERIFRRGKINIAYSEGFNPHPKMSFSPALQLGVESDCEYIDLEMKEEVNPQDVINSLNKVTVSGIEFLEGTVLPEKPGSIVAFITHSLYQVNLEIDDSLIGQVIKKIDQINDSSEILLSKRTKKGNLLEYDLKKYIGRIEYEIFADGLILNYEVCSGSVKSINPKIVLELLLEGLDEEQYYILIRKLDTYQRHEETGEISRPLSEGLANHE